MSETHDQSVTVNTTETAATAPARLDALQIVAGLTDRKLALFHFNEARSLLESLEHEIRTYGDEEEADPFRTLEADAIAAKGERIVTHLIHVRAIATESAALAAKALPPPTT